MIRSLIGLLAGIAAWFTLAAPAAAEGLRFGVLNQRNPVLTAQYWNPILAHVSRSTGIGLELRIGRSAPETTAMAVRGELDLYYTNHLFTVDRDRLGWQVFARRAGDGIRGAIVVLEESPVQTLGQLADRDVVFPSPEAFAGYWVPMDALLARDLTVTPRFGGSQEAAIAQLRAGAVAAAGVSATVMAEYAQREGLRYRSIWVSDSYPDLALMAHPRVPASVVERLRDAFVGMSREPEGLRILEASAALMKQQPPLGFVAAEGRDYDGYRRFYRQTRVRAAD